MKGLFSKAARLLPHPCKAFQRYFQIENEVVQLKAYFRPYRFSLFLFFGLLSFPLVKPLIQTYSEPTKKEDHARLFLAEPTGNRGLLEADRPSDP